MHIGIIPDGNRRWSVLHNQSIEVTYAKSAKLLFDIFTQFDEVTEFTVFGLSMENFSKRGIAVETILNTFIDTANEFRNSDRFQFKFFGEIGGFSDILVKKIVDLEQNTSKAKKRINVLVNYSSAFEFKSYLGGRTSDRFTFKLSPINLLIRTGGKRHLSNFIAFQSANAEIFFVDEFWPEFSIRDMRTLVDEYIDTEFTHGS